jgi:hypothetical protein
MSANKTTKNIQEMIDLAQRAGLRQKEVLEGTGKRPAMIRKDVPIVHGFRKFFTTQLVKADIKTEIRWLLEGHGLLANDRSYVKVSENVNDLLEQYTKAIDNLTINEENRLQRTIEILKVEKSRIDELEDKIQKLERRHGRIR